MRAAVEKLRYIVPKCATHSDGCGPIVELSSAERGKLLVLTLDINCVLEQETLLVSIWGSADADNWGTTAHWCHFARKATVDYIRPYSIW